MKSYNIAIVGATGLVGRTFLTVMEQLQVPVTNIRMFASSRSVGTTITFNHKTYEVEEVHSGCFSNTDYALFSAGAKVSLDIAKQAVAEGAIVIDNSSAWRMDEDVPLVVPEINMSDVGTSRLIANPNCSTIQSVLPLYPLHQEYTVTQVEYNTYQAVSGSGQQGLHDLQTPTDQETTSYPYDIRQTAIPQVDIFLPDGYTKEEHKMINETRKILHEKDLPISATCVRVPVAHGHGVSIRATFKQQPSIDQVRTLLENQPGIVLLDDPNQLSYPTSIHAIGHPEVFVGRIRIDTINPNTVLMYVVADNILKGAAYNAVQIMMEMMKHE